MNKQQIVYTPQGGVCSNQIVIDVEDGIIAQVQVNNGCAGNSKGVAMLLKGMTVEEAINRLQGITCGRKSTSCPDQIAQALKEMKNDE